MQAALLLLAIMLQSQEAGRIVDVQVRNNRRVRSDSIKYHLQTKAGEVIRADVIARDVRTLYALGHFDDITVYEEDAANGKIVVFVVKERPVIRAIEYEGAASITRSEILERLREKKIGLSQESPYDATRIKKAETIIKQMLAEKGRQNASIEAVVEEMPPNAVAVTFKIDEGPKIKVEAIHVDGNAVFSDRQVKRAMKLTKETGPISAISGKDTYFDQKLGYDIAQIGIKYGQQGYVRANILEPAVEVKPKQVYRTLPFIKPPFPWGIPLPFSRKTVDRYYITIKIEENDQYRVGEVRVAGSKEFTPEQIKAVLGLIPGEVYNEEALRKSFDNLKKIYGSRGYVNYTAVPTPDYDEEKKVVNVTVNVDEDRQFLVNRVRFIGNTTTRDKVIRREIMVDEGSIYNSALWEMSVLRLNQLGYFEEVKAEDAEIRPNPTTNEVDITLKVKEKGRNSIGFNGGVSGIGGSFLGLSYSTNNFLGLGETFSLSLQGGTRQSQYQLSFTEPYLFNRPIATGFSVFSTSYRYDQAREVYGLDPADLPSGLGLENRLNFEQSRSGFSTSVSYPVRLFHRLGLSYQYDSSKTSAINPATQEFFNSVIADERASFVTGGGTYDNYYSRRMTLTYSVNSTNSYDFPTAGRSFTGSLEFTGGFLGGNVNFYRPAFEFRNFKPMNNGRNTLAMRALVSYVQGFSNTSVPFYERFFLGGDFDVRGFDFRSLSPIAFIKRNVDTVDLATGRIVNVPYDDIVYVGGDTQGVFNLEYRIPLAGPAVTLAPFLDVGNTWVLKKRALQRRVVDSKGIAITEQVRFLPGTNAGVRISTGVELQIVMPVIQAPFRLVFALNPSRIDRTYIGPVSGTPLAIREPGRDFKLTVGKTF